MVVRFSLRKRSRERNRTESSWNRDSRIEEFGSVMEAYDSKVEASVVQIGSVREDDVRGR